MFLSLRDALSKYVTLDDHADTVVNILQPTMVKGWYKGQRKVIFTMWETDELPRSMSELLPQFDVVLVPCDHNKKVFSKHHDDVRVVPLGIDTKLWEPSAVVRRPGPFRFLAGGSHWMRKGLDVVLEAFSRVEGDVELHIKCGANIIGGVPEIKDNRVTVHRDIMTPQQEVDFYKQHDCFISMSRGEGWGLMPLQAIAAGIPTILSDTSGHRMFSHLANHIVDTIPVPAHDGNMYRGGQWDEPNLETLVTRMREVINTTPPTKHQEAATYTWDNSAQILLTTLNPGGKLNNPQWESSDQATTKVQALRPIHANIGRHTIILAKNEIKEIPINAKNVLLEAGLINLV